jgi:hypothetical protein
MCDMYVYYFIRSNGEGGESELSTRPGTLEAIKGRGQPVMETQIVVDHTELDAEGFFLANKGNGLHAMDNVAAQIGSLEARASSRDTEAIDSLDGIEKYMLSLESRELRKQAQDLKSRQSTDQQTP